MDAGILLLSCLLFAFRDCLSSSSSSVVVVVVVCLWGSREIISFLVFEILSVCRRRAFDDATMQHSFRSPALLLEKEHPPRVFNSFFLTSSSSSSSPKTDSPKCVSFPIRSNPSNEREKPPSNVVALHHHRRRHPKRTTLIFRVAKRFYPPPPARLR